MSDDHFCCKWYDRNTCYLTDVWNSTAGTRVNFDYIYIFSTYDELDVDHTNYVKGFCKTLCIFFNFTLCHFRNALRRIYRNTVTRMDSGTLNMFHNTRDQNVCSITYCIDLNFFTDQIFINQNRVILCNTVDDSDKFINIMIVDCNLHSLSAKYIRRTNQNRVTLRTWNIALCKDLVKELSVLCGIYIFCGSSKNRHSHLHQGFC